ncbi:hypothetical protein D3C76_1695700 [compost metagenome]
MQWLVVKDDGLLQQTDQACAEAIDFAAVIHAIEHQDEFVTPQARDQVDIAGAVAQAGRHLLQYGVTGGVAEGVVDRLEVVQVQQQ